MRNSKAMRVCFLSTGRTKMIISCENSSTVQAVSGMHVTPLEYQNTTFGDMRRGFLTTKKKLPAPSEAASTRIVKKSSNPYICDVLLCKPSTNNYLSW